MHWQVCHYLEETRRELRNYSCSRSQLSYSWQLALHTIPANVTLTTCMETSRHARCAVGAASPVLWAPPPPPAPSSPARHRSAESRRRRAVPVHDRPLPLGNSMHSFGFCRDGSAVLAAVRPQNARISPNTRRGIPPSSRGALSAEITGSVRRSREDEPAVVLTVPLSKTIVDDCLVMVLKPQCAAEIVNMNAAYRRHRPAMSFHASPEDIDDIMKVSHVRNRHAIRRSSIQETSLICASLR